MQDYIDYISGNPQIRWSEELMRTPGYVGSPSRSATRCRCFIMGPGGRPGMEEKIFSREKFGVFAPENLSPVHEL